jgi:hypothetical protein
MGLLDNLKGVLTQYAAGNTPTGDPGAHFTQVAQAVDPSVLASGIAAAMRSDQTPAFGQMVGQMFANGTIDQKVAMLNTLLGSISPEQRARLSTLFPALGNLTSINPSQVSSMAPTVIQDIAQQVEKHDSGIIEKMSATYAAHPTLVKTLGTMAMVIAMRKIAEHHQLNA